MKILFRWINWAQQCPTSVIIALTTCGKIGFKWPAPGTIGSIIGIGTFVLFYYSLNTFSPFLYALLLGLAVYGSIVLCGEAEKRLGQKDPPAVILDEIVAIPFCFIGLDVFLYKSNVWLVLLGGFVLFRLFDIFKPFPIYLLQRLPGGLGIVVDDLAAALLTSVVLNTIFRVSFHYS